jgi:hypothetical protein
MNQDTARMIDLCLGSAGSHHDVARAAHAVIGHSFRYVGNGMWEYQAPDGRWVADEKQSELRAQLRAIVGGAFTERALWWHSASATVDDRDKFDCQLRACRLSQLVIKMSKEKYLKDLVKECREFFVAD